MKINCLKWMLNVLILSTIVMTSACFTVETEQSEIDSPSMQATPTVELIIPVAETPGSITPEISTRIPSPRTGQIMVNNTILIKGNGQPVVLIDNPNAVNVTYSQLKTFSHNDPTDKNEYMLAFTSTTHDVDFTCGDFAELLHNNAEASGIKAGLVYVKLPGYSDHALNIFETTDRGLVFIDSTGPFWLRPVTPPWMVSFGEPQSWDKVAYLEKGKPIGFIELYIAERYGFDYSSYEMWKVEKAKFDELIDSYGKEITREQEQNLRAHEYRLGGFFEEEDTLIDYQIFWEGNV